MKKPSVFISSTIHDFHDLRSALKYWLEEAGYNVQMSEYADFEKDAASNSYKACLEVISNCDYFILLIGSRVGGLMPKKETSITREEYRTAYDLFKQGRIKKIVTFVRQCVWDVISDRKELKKLLEHDSTLEYIDPHDKERISNHCSKLLQEANHIMGFVDEVKRKEESESGEEPKNNWINSFSSFSDVIQVLKIEMGISQDISEKIAEHNVKTAVLSNLKHITTRDKHGKMVVDYSDFQNIHEQVIDYWENCKTTHTRSPAIILTKNDIKLSFDFMFNIKIGVDDLESYIFENIVAKGSFLRWDTASETYISSNLNKALRRMIQEIRQLNKRSNILTNEDQVRIFEIINEDTDTFSFDVPLLTLINAIYESKVNLLRLSLYVLEYIETHNDDNKNPFLLGGLVKDLGCLDDDLNKLYIC